MWRQKIFAIVMLLLFMPASMAQAAPLVWCLAPSGHSAIELDNGGCHKPSALSEASLCSVKSGSSLPKWAGKPNACLDVALSQTAQTPTKVLSKMPPSPEGVALKALSVGVEAHCKLAPIQPGLLNPAAIQLAQLRTVVLLI